MSLRRMLVTWLAVASLLGACGRMSPAAAAETVKVGLNFLPNGVHVGLAVAKEQGWYREAGLEVDLQKGEGSTDAVRRMGSGVVEFAMADLGSLILGRSRGLPVKALGVVLDKDPAAMISLKTAGIRTPKDLEGKSIGAATASAQSAYQAKNSLTPRKNAITVTTKSSATPPPLRPEPWSSEVL